MTVPSPADSRAGRRTAALGASAVFLGALVVWMVIAAAIAAVVELSTLGAVSAASLSPVALVADLYVQHLGFVGLAALVAYAWATPGWPALAGERRASGLALGVAAVAALGVGPVSSGVLDVLTALWPALDAARVDVLPEALLASELATKLAMVLAIALLAPIAEELVFRGVLWRLLEDLGPPWVQWLVTSALFAAYHGSVAYAVALLPIALLLGWLRWKTGSVWPSLVAHATNNAVAVAVVLGGWSERLGSAAAALAGAAAVVVALGALHRWGERR